MPNVELTKRFLKDFDKWKKSGKNMAPFDEFVSVIHTTWPPPSKYEAHLLSGELEGIWDIHIRQNWIVLAEFHNETVTLLRMGTHADLKL